MVGYVVKIVTACVGLDWGRVVWQAQDAPPPERCSYCRNGLGPDPWIFFRSGRCAHFCVGCQRRWWTEETNNADSANYA